MPQCSSRIIIRTHGQQLTQDVEGIHIPSESPLLFCSVQYLMEVYAMQVASAVCSVQYLMEIYAMQVASAVEAWYYNPAGDDWRLPHQYHPNRPVSPHQLQELGVLVWELDADNYENKPDLENIKKQRGYNYSDIVTVAPGQIEDYEGKIKLFFTEHLHAQEEIRFVLEGGAYFDIRDNDEKWIRFRIKKGHLIVLPQGMYHRFTLDTTNYVKAMRLFMGLPCWTQHQRPADDMEARKNYVAKVLNKPVAAAQKTM